MSCKYNNCKICGYKSECEIYKENAKLQDKLNNLARVAEVRLANWQKYEQESADLKEEINKIAFARGNLEEENAELKKELKKWKDEWQEQVQKATDEGYARTLQTMQLTTAIEIIKDLLSLCEGETDSKLVFTRAEQFLKGDDCPDCLCEDCTKDCDIDNAIQQANKGLDLDKIADEMEQDLKDSEVEK